MTEELSEEEFSKLAEEELDESTLAKLKRGAEITGEKLKVAASKAKEEAKIAGGKFKEAASTAQEKIKEQDIPRKIRKVEVVGRKIGSVAGSIAQRAREFDEKLRTAARGTPSQERYAREERPRTTERRTPMRGTYEQEFRGTPRLPGMEREPQLPRMRGESPRLPEMGGKGSSLPGMEFVGGRNRLPGLTLRTNRSKRREKSKRKKERKQMMKKKRREHNFGF